MAKINDVRRGGHQHCINNQNKSGGEEGGEIIRRCAILPRMQRINETVIMAYRGVVNQLIIIKGETSSASAAGGSVAGVGGGVKYRKRGINGIISSRRNEIMT